MKWLFLLVLLFSLTACFGDDDNWFDDGDVDVDTGNDTYEAGDYDLYWDDIETLETADYPEPTMNLAYIVILISLFQGVIWMTGVPVGLGGYRCRST